MIQVLQSILSFVQIAGTSWVLLFFVVLNLSSIASKIVEANIECHCNFKAIDDDDKVDYPYNVPLE